MFDEQHSLERGTALLDEYCVTHTLSTVTISDFLKMELPPKGMLLSPWLPEQGLAMVYAPRGIGKTFFALNVACTVASGGEFLRWKAPNACKVLYLDGEMPANTMQERLRDITDTQDKQIPEGNLILLTPDLQIKTGASMPNLSTRLGQQAIETLLDGVALVVIDNISTLCNGGAENEAESWVIIQEWVLKLRSRGVSVLFVHHAGKGGGQRGTSKREDTLDTSISLKRPPDYTAQKGAHFEVHFEKARGFSGDDAESIDCKLDTDHNNKPMWTWQLLENSTYQRVIELAKEGVKQTDIASELDINRSTVSRHIKRAKSEGKLL